MREDRVVKINLYSSKGEFVRIQHVVYWILTLLLTLQKAALLSPFFKVVGKDSRALPPFQ